MEKRSFLVDELGYGTIPLYVGQQITGPGSHIVTPEQGVADGQDMVAVMSRAGYPFGSRGFNDLENGAPMPSNQQGYAQGMGGKVVDLGWLYYGLYASHSFADVAAHVVPGASIWTFKVPTTNKTTAVLPVPDFPDDMAGSGYLEAMIWQYRPERDHPGPRRRAAARRPQRRDGQGPERSVIVKLVQVLLGLFCATALFWVGLLYDRLPAGWPNYQVSFLFFHATLHAPGAGAVTAANARAGPAPSPSGGQCRANEQTLQAAINAQNAAAEQAREQAGVRALADAEAALVASRTALASATRVMRAPTHLSVERVVEMSAPGCFGDRQSLVQRQLQQ